MRSLFTLYIYTFASDNPNGAYRFRFSLLSFLIDWHTKDGLVSSSRPQMRYASRLSAARAYAYGGDTCVSTRATWSFKCALTHAQQTSGLGKLGFQRASSCQFFTAVPSVQRARFRFRYQRSHHRDTVILACALPDDFQRAIFLLFRR